MGTKTTVGFIRLISVIAILSFSLTGCNISPLEGTQRSAEPSVQVKSGQDVILAPDDAAIEVHISGSSISGEGMLSVTTASGPEDEKGWEIKLEGTELTGEAKLRFKNAITDGEPAPLIAFQRSPDAPLDFDVTAIADGNDIEVTTSHFSSWFVISWDWLKSWANEQINKMVQISDNEAPECTGAEGFDRIRVTSSESSRVKWCLGTNDAKEAIIKILNNRGYGVAVESTPGLKLLRTDKNVSFVFQQAAGKIGVYPSKKGNNVEILAPGERAEFVIEDFAKDEEGIRISPSPTASAATALWFAGETAAVVWGKLKNGDTNKVAQDVERAMEAVDCVSGLGDMNTAEVSNSREAASYLQSSLETVTPCTSQILDHLAESWLDKLAVKMLDVFTWLTGGIKHVFSNAVGAFETVRDGGNYQILVRNNRSQEDTSAGSIANKSPSKKAQDLCSEVQLRNARSDTGEHWLLETDQASGEFYYDVFSIHGCKEGYALIEANHSGGSVFNYWALAFEDESWKLITSSTKNLSSPTSDPVFEPHQVDIGFQNLGMKDHEFEFYEAVGWNLKNGRLTVIDGYD